MVKSDDHSVTPIFFLPKITSEKAVNRSIFCSILIILLLPSGFFAVNTMAIQKGKKFIELTTRNSRIHYK